MWRGDTSVAPGLDVTRVCSVLHAGEVWSQGSTLKNLHVFPVPPPNLLGPSVLFALLTHGHSEL